MSALFMILVSLKMTLFSEKTLISNRCISGLMSNIYIIKSDVCLFVCLSTLECPPNYSSSFDGMGYPRVPMASLWPNGGNKSNWGKIWAKIIFFFKKIPYVIPSALLSFLLYYCHSFRIFVIPSGFLSLLPYLRCLIAKGTYGFLMT